MEADPVEHQAHVDEGALAQANPLLVEVLVALRGVTSSMSTLFSTLAADPARYGAVRDELSRLDGERRALLERLGELVSTVLVLEAASDVSVDVEAFPPSAESPVESEGAEVDVEPSPPLSQQDVIAALRGSPLEEKSARPSGGSDDKGALLSFANHVAINTKTPADLDDEISLLERATAEARVAQWKKMSESAQVRWVRILVAWAKALEEEARAHGDGELRIATVFRRLRVFSKYDSPGYIHGFAREAVPDGDGWRADAAEMLAGLRGRTREPETPKPLAVVYDEVDVEDARESRVSDDWPYFFRVRGKNVVMMGGEVREERRLALEEAFQCAAFTWVPHNRPRLLQALAERAAQGTVDIILVNKFVGHRETQALERASVVPVISVRLGYGVTAVKTALEDYFGKRAASGA